MNLTSIGSIPSSKWKRIKGQYIAAAASVALTVSAVVMAGPWQGNSYVAPATGNVSMEFARQEAPLHHYFYIVATEAERGALLSAGATDVVLSGSAAADALQGEGARELSAVGTQFSIIDMTQPQHWSPRGRWTPTSGASALGTELAHFGYVAPVEQR
jgi:hypothetical protein